MSQVQPVAPGVEVTPRTVLSVMRGIGPWEDAARRILSRNGIESPPPERRYPQQVWLDVFRKIGEVGGKDLYAMGKSVPQRARWPAWINTVKDALASIDMAYHMNHATDGRCLFDATTWEATEAIGHYRYRDVGEREAEITCENPCPCAFDRGIVFAVAERFRPQGSVVRVDHGQTCRAGGDAACVLKVTW